MIKYGLKQTNLKDLNENSIKIIKEYDKHTTVYLYL